MNADLQNPRQVQRPKSCSHLTIKVQSRLMSRSRTPSSVSKPAVAPKPRPLSDSYLHGSRPSLSNGDLAHSDGETDSQCVAVVKEREEEERYKAEETHNGEGREKDIETSDNTAETENGVSLDTLKGADEACDTTDNDIAEDLNSTGIFRDDTLLSTDNAVDDRTSTLSSAKTETDLETDVSGEEEDKDATTEPTEMLLGPSEIQHENIGEDCIKDKDHGLVDKNKISNGVLLQCEPSEPTDGNMCSCDGEVIRFTFGSNLCALPTVCEETPYDLTGPTDCEETPYDLTGPTDDGSDTCESCDLTEAIDWQPERATKDPSGRFRFTASTEDMFGPYAVIEALPDDLYSIADPDWGEDDIDDETPDPLETVAGDSNQDHLPHVLSDVDVEESEDPKAPGDEEVKGDGEQPVISQDSDNAKDTESVDEYADIEDSLCPEVDDSQQLECVSSEDYVEIGDDDEEDDRDMKPIKGKSVKERTAKREQRNSCQPRLRLCNITVPVDLELGRTPELANRVVFAHTTEAFEEDIEELDCHIVPYDDDTESDSDEHIYEEAGFDSDGENFISLDRKTIVTRSRSYSGKVSSFVPETVPEETGPEYQTNDYCTVALDVNGEPLNHLPEHQEVNRLIPSLKPRRFLLYSRSAELSQMSLGSPTDIDQTIKDGGRMKSMDETMSLPCMITSSGSFSQRSHQSSSGVSTPTSMVDIPPPFELVHIAKRPVTKSSPSLLIQHDTTDMPKKKKSSFKRFLALKFRRKTESKGFIDGSVRSSRSSSESSHHGPARVIELDRRSTGSSPQLQTGLLKPQLRSDLPSTLILYSDRQKRKGDPFGRGVSRVESFEERSRRPLMPLPLTKPRSISFPSADTSDYENIPAMSSDYENIQIPGRPIRSFTVTEFFEDPNRATMPSNENDGYVDMNSFPGIDSTPHVPQDETESAYTEPFPMRPISASLSADEDHGRTSEEEEGGMDQGYDRQIDGRSRAFYVAKELVESERLHVNALKRLQEDFRRVAEAAVGEEGEPVIEQQRLGEILGVLPKVYSIHSSMLTELEERISQWEESQRVVDVILSRRDDFGVFDAYISEYDRSMSLLEESNRNNPAFAAVVKKFETESQEGGEVPLRHQLLQVIVRVLQYRMLLTDYLNNLSPDSKEYEDTQAALVIVSEVADQASDSLKHGENLLRLVHIEYSVRGKRDLLKAGRVFVKEGTLMKVSRKCRQPRHLFLMNDMMLYTYPQQDGKYRLKNTLSLSGMKVSKPVLDQVLNCLRIEVSDITIILSASSVGEREDWFHTLSRAIADNAAGLCTFGGPCSEAREKLWMALGEAAPVLVPVSHVMMCMNCTSDFSLTLRRHHCNACGKVVCRSCSRNRYPLKYLKDRVAKVCDHCYAELRKRGGSVSGACGNASPHTQRVSRPLSAVFQSLQPPNLWRSRKSSSTLSQVSLGAEGSTMSGSLQRRKKSKRKWKRLWFLLKDKDKVASESLPLQGLTVKLPTRPEEGGGSSVFQLYHKKTLYYSFRAEDQNSAHRWVNAIEEATIL
ncbi:FYVE, RhoGEF and PH domain-containing protein 5 isoform X2 [Gadus morhua]|uniref:FYVE, RhoGEF and PH domain-containing protein 5 isoform X2 n=1 Tax=Gadus morhua TaxID=8049 RepID=UPI0011B6816B|nr:FYVE, RhoGEF and PH domain-containing protein 5-like isoform X2 [Gadus morhua]